MGERAELEGLTGKRGIAFGEASPERALQVLARPAASGRLRRARRQATAPHLVELRARLHVLGPKCGLDAVKQSF